MTRRLIGLAALALALLAASPASAQQPGAQLRVLHAAPGAPALDVYIDGGLVIRDVAYGAASEYLTVPAGTRTVQVAPAGRPPSEALFTEGHAFAPGGYVTMGVRRDGSALRPLFLADDRAAPPAGQSAVRVVHLVPDAPAVDVRARGGPTLAANLSYGRESRRVTLPAGTYDLVVSPAGTGLAAFSLPGVAVEGGRIYDVYAIGLLSGTPRLAPVVLASVPAQGAPAPPPAEAGRVCFPETGRCAGGRILAYWRQNGGLPVFGFPLTDELSEGGRTVQYFERQRFELHPVNQPPYDVLLGRLGDDLLRRQGIDWRTFPAAEGERPGCRLFAETGHAVCDTPGGPRFLSYWSANGLQFDGRAGASYAESLALFGLPLSEPMEMTIEGRSVLVQWFERARFEYHPQNPAPYQVLLGRLGAEVAP
jgi:hypothetical protein